jgi:hypothetical protein
MSSVWEDVDELLARYDSSLRFEIASACDWSGELRLTLTDPENAPSRSVTFFSAGGGDPEEVAHAVLADAVAWLAESDQQPLPVPEWLRQCPDPQRCEYRWRHASGPWTCAYKHPTTTAASGDAGVTAEGIAGAIVLGGHASAPHHRGRADGS